jgi:ribosomal protein S26
MQSRLGWALQRFENTRVLLYVLATRLRQAGEYRKKAHGADVRLCVQCGKNIPKEKKIFASKNRIRSDIQKNIGDKSKSRLERQSVQVSRKVCADKYEEERLG